MKSSRALRTIPSSIICSTIGFGMLLSPSKPSPHLLLSSHWRNQAIVACWQWLGECVWEQDVDKLDYILMCCYIFLIFFETKACNMDHKKHCNSRRPDLELETRIFFIRKIILTGINKHLGKILDSR